jgi:hypothetical protein
MVDLDTTDDRGDDPLESLEKYDRHAANVQELREVAAKVDGIADSMQVDYNEDVGLGTIKLHFEFYEDENAE